MRSVIAVVMGGVVAVVVYQLGVTFAFASEHGIPLGSSPQPPSESFSMLTLAIAGLAGMAGGWTAARLASQRPRAHACVLALGLAALVLWGFSEPNSQWPDWYAPVLAVVGSVTTVAGGATIRGN